MLELNNTTPYLTVASEVLLCTPTTKGKGWGGEGLSYSIFCISIGKGRVRGRGW
jgi:hypothetical protein